MLDRKPSEERRISQAPSLDTIEDDLQKSREDALDETLTASALMKKSDEMKSKVILSIGNVNLTESSSSGSICESVVTAYEHNGKKKAKSSSTTSLDGIFKTSQTLLSKAPKPRTETAIPQIHPIQFNYEDLSIVDHRVKLFLFQNVLEENDEKLMWLVRCLVIEDDVTSSGQPYFGLVVMSTKKLYILKIVGDEGEDVASWLRKSFTNGVDRIDSIREIPSKVGFSFMFNSNINIHLLLQDQNLSDRLYTHMTTSSNIYKIFSKFPVSINFYSFLDQSLEISTANKNEKLSRLLNQHDLKCMAVFTSCATSISSATDSDQSQDSPKLCVKYGTLLVTTDEIHFTTSFRWLCDYYGDKMSNNHQTLTQPMSNLVELESVTKTTFTLNFMDELENTIEKWRLSFESYPRIARTLDTIDGIWQKIFCVPLINEDQILS